MPPMKGHLPLKDTFYLYVEVSLHMLFWYVRVILLEITGILGFEDIFGFGDILEIYDNTVNLCVVSYFIETQGYFVSHDNLGMIG